MITIEPVLTPQLSPRYALRLRHLLATAAFSAFFVLLQFIPLRPNDLWLHVLLGRWIATEGHLPAEDPFLPLAEGMPLLDSAWLSQLAFAGAEHLGGAAALSSLYALLMLAAALVLARTFFLQTSRLSLAVAGTLMVLAVGFSRVATFRPETFAWLAFAVLLWLVTAGSRRRVSGVGIRVARNRRSTDPVPDERTAAASPGDCWWLWCGMFVLFALWANMHGSFVCGVAFLGCLTMGRAIEVAWQTRSVGKLTADGPFRRWLYLTELAAVATLVNPYGIDLWIETLRFSANPNLTDVLEWLPMSFLGVGGREFTASLVVLLLVFRHSRRRVTPAEVLSLTVFGLAAAARIRMIGWFAPVYAWVVLPHVAEIVDRLANSFWGGRFARGMAAETAPQRTPSLDGGSLAEESTTALPPGRRWVYTLLAMLIVWVGFSLSDVSRPLLGGKPRSDRQLLGQDTPLGLTKYLNEHPPQGQVFNPQAWGDWLVWKGPPGLRPFMTTNIHIVPRHVWLDYERLVVAQPGWQQVLKRYRVDTVLVDKQQQPILAPVLRRDTEWELTYEDEQALVFVRKPQPASKPAAEIADFSAYQPRFAQGYGTRSVPATMDTAP